MLFGKSLFQSVVDRLGEEAEEQGPSEEPSFRINGLATSFVPSTSQQSAGTTDLGTDQRLDAYLSLMPDAHEIHVEEPEPFAPAPRPEWVDRLSPDEIASDLGLASEDDRDTLQERRRAFARENHPDTVAEEFRDAATTRMKVANRLIDDAITRSAWALRR